MPKSTPWIAAAALTVLAIILYSNLFAPSPWFQTLVTTTTQNNVFLAGETDGGALDTAAEVGLTLTFPRQSDTLSFSTQAEVARFILEGNGPFTLRYLTFQITTQGLKPIEGWTVYEITKNSVDFSKPVGYAEITPDSYLRLRLFSSPSAAYVFEDAKQEFVLVGKVLTDITSSMPPAITLNFPTQLPPELDFAWLPGVHAKPWLNVSESLGISDVVSLPTDSLSKH